MKTVFGVKEFLTSGWIIRTSPGHWLLGWGKWKPQASAPAAGPALYAPDFFLKTPGWIQTPDSIEMSSDELWTHLSPWVGVRLDPAPWTEPRRSEFDTMFASIQAAIGAGELAKAVPIVFAQRRQSLTASARCALVLSLIDLPESLFGYGVWSATEGMIGSTPEILFELKGSRLSTMALAGTLRKPATESELAAFMADKKERFEHQLVIDSLNATLDPLGVVSVGETYAVELPHLYHLRTDISMHLEEKADVAKLVAALHPTPALGTSPREKFNWLETLPGADERARFGAPFVVRKTDGSTTALVSIRCLQWNDDVQRIGSGCGIVAASVADNEWKELAAKRQSVRAALKI